MMKSTKQLQTEIAFLTEIGDLSDRLGNERSDWDMAERQKVSRRLAHANQQLRGVGKGLDWTFEGQGVYPDHSIAISQLVHLLDPIGQALRNIGRDMAFLDGAPAFAPLGERIEPVVTDTFDGSFGVRIGGPPVATQLTFEETPPPSIFELAAERLVRILAATLSEDTRSVVIAEVTGLRANAVSGLRRVMQVLDDTNTLSYVRWQGETPIRLSRPQISALRAILEEVTPSEEVVPVVGRLMGGDLAGDFHIVVDGFDQPSKHYRGKAQPIAAAAMDGIPLGSIVRATITVISTDSQFMAEPRETYVLNDVARFNEL